MNLKFLQENLELILDRKDRIYKMKFLLYSPSIKKKTILKDKRHQLRLEILVYLNYNCNYCRGTIFSGLLIDTHQNCKIKKIKNKGDKRQEK